MTTRFSPVRVGASGAGGAAELRTSDDGSRVAWIEYSAQSSPNWRVFTSTANGTATQVAPGGALTATKYTQLSVSDEGSKLLYVAGADAARHAPVLLDLTAASPAAAAVPAPLNTADVLGATLSGDGAHVATYYRDSYGSGSYHLGMWDLRTATVSVWATSATAILPARYSMHGLAVSDNGTRLAYYTGDDNVCRPYILSHSGTATDVGISPTGLQATVRCYGARGGELDTTYASAPVLSGDGNTVAFGAVTGDPDNHSPIWVRNLATGTTTQADPVNDLTGLSEHAFNSSMPSTISDDGAVISWRSDNTGWIRDLRTCRPACSSSLTGMALAATTVNGDPAASGVPAISGSAHVLEVSGDGTHLAFVGRDDRITDPAATPPNGSGNRVYSAERAPDLTVADLGIVRFDQHITTVDVHATGLTGRAKARIIDSTGMVYGPRDLQVSYDGTGTTTIAFDTFLWVADGPLTVELTDRSGQVVYGTGTALNIENVDPDPDAEDEDPDTDADSDPDLAVPGPITHLTGAAGPALAGGTATLRLSWRPSKDADATRLRVSAGSHRRTIDVDATGRTVTLQGIPTGRDVHVTAAGINDAGHGRAASIAMSGSATVAKMAGPTLKKGTSRASRQVRVTIRTASGGPAKNMAATVQVLVGRSWRVGGTVRTNVHGQGSARVRVGKVRKVRVFFAGKGSILGSTSTPVRP